VQQQKIPHDSTAITVTVM